MPNEYAVINSAGVVERWVVWCGKTILTASDGKPAILTAVTDANAASLAPANPGWNNATPAA